MAAIAYENSHIVQRELDVLLSLRKELDELFGSWQDILTDEQEQSEILKWYEEQSSRVTEFHQKIEQWITEAKRVRTTIRHGIFQTIFNRYKI